MSTEIASPITQASTADRCRSCGAALAHDQRYCLECGERCVPMSSVLAGSPSGAQAGEPGSPAQHPPGIAPDERPRQRNAALTVIAGVGVLLLAMGVGVLIGRAGEGKQTPGPAQVITVDQGGGSAPAAGAGTEATFTSDWPAGSKGYTVQLQTLPAASAVSAVAAAKSAASGKGAAGVGALKAEEFPSLTSTGYVIYSGDYHTRAEAQKALASLKKSFPAATVVEVSSGSAKGSASSTPASTRSGSSINHPAPPSVLKTNKAAGSGKGAGKNYEEESAKLPDVVETG